MSGPASPLAGSGGGPHHAAMARRGSYLICATPRAGTTLLCDLLTATGQAGAPDSYYRRQDMPRRAEAWGVPQDDPRDPARFDRRYLDAVLRAGSGGTDVFGLRLMWGTLAELCVRLSRLYPEVSGAGALLEAAFGPLVYLHVSRGDKVAQAVSLLRAEQSGLWHLAADGSERQRSAPAGPVRYDADRLGEIVDELERDDAAWERFFAAQGVAPVRVKYEELALRPDLAKWKILDALGCAGGLAAVVEPRTAQMADRLSAAWRKRFLSERANRADQPR